MHSSSSALHKCCVWETDLEALCPLMINSGMTGLGVWRARSCTQTQGHRGGRGRQQQGLPRAVL